MLYRGFLKPMMSFSLAVRQECCRVVSVRMRTQKLKPGLFLEHRWFYLSTHIYTKPCFPEHSRNKFRNPQSLPLASSGSKQSCLFATSCSHGHKSSSFSFSSKHRLTTTILAPAFTARESLLPVSLVVICHVPWARACHAPPLGLTGFNAWRGLIA